MPASLSIPSRSLCFRLLLLLVGLLAACNLTLRASAQTTINASITQSVWQMTYGVSNAQINQTGIYASGSAKYPNGWLAGDDDGDGLTNGEEMAAGTNPFSPNSTVKVSSVAMSGGNFSVSFPTMNGSGKSYTLQATPSLSPTNWTTVGSAVTGDGTTKTIPVASSSGKYFRVVVQDQSTAGDQVADWAKLQLGYAVGTNISSQTGYTAGTLAAALATQNTVTVVATDPSTTEPASPPPATASDLGAITFTRSGFFSFNTITVPITVTSQVGTVAAIGGTDYKTSVNGTIYPNGCPSSITFGPGVNQVVLSIIPLYNANCTGSRTLTVTASAAGASAVGSYTLGSPSSATVTVYPPALGGAANGTGLTGSYYSGSNISYTNLQSLGATASSTAAYTFTPASSNPANGGSIVVTYTGAPLVPYAVGSTVYLSFTSGLLSSITYDGVTSALNSVATSTAPNSGSPYPYTNPYTISAVSAPVVFSGLTIPAASPAVVTTPTAHGFVAGTPVMFSTTGTLQTGLSTATVYYVLAAGLTGTSFQVSTTPGGSPVATTGTTQTGTQTVESASFTVPINTVSAPGSYSGISISVASPAVVTTPSVHGFAAGTAVVFGTTGALPTGLTAGTTYYVIAAGLTATTFEVSATLGGSAVATSGTQSGTQSVQWTDGYPLPGSATGAVTVTPFSGPTHAANFGGSAVNYTYTQLTSTTGTAVVTYSGTPSAAFAAGGSVNLQFTAGNLYSGMSGLFDGNYTISSVSAPVTLSGLTYAGAVITTPAAHGFVKGTPVTFSTTGALPTGLTASTATSSTTYYVIAAGLTATTFEVSTSSTGTTGVATSGTPSGTQTVQSASFTVPITAPPGVGSLPASGSSTPSNATVTPFNAVVATRVDPTVDYLWGTGQPAYTSLQIMSNQNWGARWDSWLNVPTTGTYDFQVQATDGARVYVNNQLVINAWAAGSSSTTPMNSRTLAASGITLTAGTPVPIRVEFYHLNAPTASVNLSWAVYNANVSSDSWGSIPATNTFLTQAAAIANGTTGIGWNGSYFTNVGPSPAIASAPQTISNIAISTGSPAVVTTPSAHGFVAGTPVVFSTTGALPAGLNAVPTGGGTTLAAGVMEEPTYYVLAANLTSTSFEVSTTPGGSPVATTGTGTGVQTVQSFTAFYGLPRYSDYPNEITALSWTSQPNATLPAANNFSIRWDGYLMPTKSANVSITNANPAVVSWTGNGLANGATVVFTTTGYLPSPLVPNTTYYVVNWTANNFQVSATSGGSAISTLGSTGSGTQTADATGISDNFTFDVQASDGARVYLDPTQSGTLTKIIDAWTADSSATTPMSTSPTTYPLVTGQQYHIRVEYNQTGSGSTGSGLVKLRWQSPLLFPTIAAIPAANVLRADPINGVPTFTAGLWAQYYNNSTLTDPPLYATQDTGASVNGSTVMVTYTYTSVPSQGNLGSGSNNNWAGRFNAYLQVPSTPTGTNNFSFQLMALSAGHLLVNGTEVIPFSAGTSVSAPIPLTAGQIVPVVVEFYDNNGNGQAILSWEIPGATTFTTIPTGTASVPAGTATGIAGLYQDAAATIPGVVGTYWANTGFIGIPFFADYQTNISYTGYATSVPGDSWGLNTAFSATWDGYIATATTGNYTFSLQALNKARIILNGTYVNGVYQAGTGTTVCDGWTNPGSSSTTPVTGAFSLASVPASGRTAIHVDFENSTAGAFLYIQWQPPTATSLGTIPNSVLYVDNSSTLQGVTATYYPNGTQTPPYFYQVVENNNPEWNSFYGSGTPVVGLPPSGAFSIVWTGQVLPQYTEPYWFTVKSSDGARLWVNGQLVLNKWQTQATTAENFSYPVNLQAGVFYDIKLEYLNVGGNAEVHLNWYSADQSEQVIPVSRLFPSMTGVTGAGPAGVTSPTSDVYILGSGSPPYSYTITGNNGATYSATGLPTGLSLNSSTGVISGTPSAAGNYQFTVTATTAAGSSSAVVNLNVVATVGTITREIWNGLSTTNVTELQDKITAGTAASSTDTSLKTLEDAGAGAPQTNNTGERLRGYFTVPQTGNYYFWLAASGAASDGNHTCAELWISNNNQPTSKVLRAYVSTATGSETWYASPTQKSGWISLTEGQQYYFEVLHNTGATGSGSYVSVAWYLDPTGNTPNPIANGAGSGYYSSGGILPTYVLSPWDNPPSITTPGTVYLATVNGAPGLSNILGDGSAYITTNGSTGIVHVSSSNLTSGVTGMQLFVKGNTTPILDLLAQARNFPNLLTSDGGYTWQSTDTTDLNNGNVYVAIGTALNPITVANPYGEVYGYFGKASGSQTAPSLPSYTSPTWTDDHATNPASNSRFLTQATFGPSPTDMAYVMANGYSAWITNQISLTPTHTLPYVLAHINSSAVDAYGDPSLQNAWWQNAIKAPDQLRQRVAFALSEILVASLNGPLYSNDDMLAYYYDTLIDNAFGNFRTLLKNVSLTPAMGNWLNMYGNQKGSYVTGVHANENYGREIMQLFSIGLYHLWPNGTLVLDNTGAPIPTYNQAVITGMSKSMTGWYYNQPLPGNGRLLTGGGPTDYYDPMLLVSSYHDLGTKNILDNVVLPAAIVTSQSDVSHDPVPAANQITVLSTSPSLGRGFTVPNVITSAYDVYGLNDFEQALNAIMNNGAAGPYICRQLIQRLVTSNPTNDYVYRVVRAWNGQQQWAPQGSTGVSTGVVGNLQDVITAILLDPEARSATEAAAIGFGKQREPLLRITGPVRSFPVTPLAANYKQAGGQIMRVTTTGPASGIGSASVHGLVTNDVVCLDTFVDSGGLTTNLPNTDSGISPVVYTASNITPTYTYSGSGTHLATINAPGYSVGDTVSIQFTTGSLAASPFNNVNTYTVNTAATTGTTGFFTVDVSTVGTPPSGTVGGNAFTPNDFTVNMGGFTTSLGSYTLSGTNNKTVTFSSNSVGLAVNNQIYLKFTTGCLANASPAYDGAYTVTAVNGTSSFTVNLSSASQTPGSTIASFATGSPCTITTATPHNLASNATITISGVTGGTFSGFPNGVSSINSTFTVTVTSPTTFTIPVNCTSTSGLNLPSPAFISGGSAVAPSLTGNYTVSTLANKSTILFYTTTNCGMAVGDQVWINFVTADQVGYAIGAPSGLYTVATVAPTVDGVTPGTQFTVNAPKVLTPMTPNVSSTYQAYPLNMNAATRHGTCVLEYSNYNCGNTTTNNTPLGQTPVWSATVFNFFYPNYQFPGKTSSVSMSSLGMTTPEFQLTDATDTLNLTNSISVMLNNGNANGFVAFTFNGSGNNLWMDLRSYLTLAQTQNSGIPTLVSTLGALLCGNSLTTATQTTISNYVQTLTAPTSSTDLADMQARVRAIIHLIITSAEYAIQK